MNAPITSTKKGLNPMAQSFKAFAQYGGPSIQYGGPPASHLGGKLPQHIPNWNLGAAPPSSNPGWTPDASLDEAKAEAIRQHARRDMHRKALEKDPAGYEHWQLIENQQEREICCQRKKGRAHGPRMSRPDLLDARSWNVELVSSSSISVKMPETPRLLPSPDAGLEAITEELTLTDVGLQDSIERTCEAKPLRIRSWPEATGHRPDLKDGHPGNQSAEYQQFRRSPAPGATPRLGPENPSIVDSDELTTSNSERLSHSRYAMPDVEQWLETSVAPINGVWGFWYELSKVVTEVPVGGEEPNSSQYEWAQESARMVDRLVGV